MIRVLIAEDSEIFAEMLADELRESGKFEVVGVATDGRMAVSMAAAIEPDVIAMDVYMPELDGIEAVEAIMGSRATPILMMTGAPSAEIAKLSFESLGRGAVDFIVKPTGAEGFATIARQLELVSEVPVVHRRARPPARKAARDAGGGTPSDAADTGIFVAPNPTSVPVPMAPLSPAVPAVSPVAALDGVPARNVIALVASTGGPPVLFELLRAMPSNLEAGVVIVQHMSPDFDAHFSGWLNTGTRLNVSLAKNGDLVRRGHVLVAPCDVQMRVRPNGRVALHPEGKVDGHQPSGTVLFQSVAEAYGRTALGILMTGMGKDGASGMKQLHATGAQTIVQDGDDCVVDGMPRAARNLGAASSVMPARDMPSVILAQVAEWSLT